MQAMIVLQVLFASVVSMTTALVGFAGSYKGCWRSNGPRRGTYRHLCGKANMRAANSTRQPAFCVKPRETSQAVA